MRVMRLAAAILLIVALCSAVAQAAEKRVALVIGVSNYRNAPALPNPVNDAQLIAPVLRQVGFDTNVVLDPDHQAMETALRDFGRRARGADVAVFFYAGHGLQVAGQNYLLPTSAALTDEQDLRYEAFSVQAVLDAMDPATKVKIVFLDACRDNPFARSLAGHLGTRSAAVGRGLERIDTSGSGTLIAYAADPGQVAQDGHGRDSPFTAALARHLPEPGLDIRSLMVEVRTDVLKETGSQRPWSEDGIDGYFYFVPPAAAPPRAAAGLSPETVFWQSISASTNAADFQAYLDQFPNGTFAALARNRVHDLGARPAQQLALATPTPTPAPTPPPPPALPAGVTRDCPDCPDMMRISAGSFAMGIPEAESKREYTEHDDADSRPVHPVTIGQAFLLGRADVTRRQYAAFARATSRAAAGGCFTWTGTKYETSASASWASPGFAQTEDDPVVCVSWTDAQAYTTWLSQRSGQRYRLPTEAEWEYAARAGTRTARYWGDGADAQCEYANGADQTAKARVPGASGWIVAACDDGFTYTSPVGHFRPNAFGLYDMLGNAWQWVADCYAEGYSSAPGDGSARNLSNCSFHVIRGGAWSGYPAMLRAGYRDRIAPGIRNNYVGFRVARTVGP